MGRILYWAGGRGVLVLGGEDYSLHCAQAAPTIAPALATASRATCFQSFHGATSVPSLGTTKSPNKEGLWTSSLQRRDKK